MLPAPHQAASPARKRPTEKLKKAMAESPSKKARVDELAKFISDTNDAYEKLHLVRAAALFTELSALCALTSRGAEL